MGTLKLGGVLSTWRNTVENQTERREKGKVPWEEREQAMNCSGTFISHFCLIPVSV